MTIKLFWAPKTRSMRAIWLLEEIGEPYEVVRIDLGGNRDADPDFPRASPMRKVPALVDGKVAVAESAAIALYLGDRYSLGNLAPALDAPDRGAYLYWTLFTPAVLEPAMTEKVTKTAPNTTRNGWGDFDRMVDVLRAGLKTGPWILGDEFSIADVMLGGSVAFMRQFGLLPDAAELNDYANRVVARPGYIKAKEADA